MRESLLKQKVGCNADSCARCKAGAGGRKQPHPSRGGGACSGFFRFRLQQIATVELRNPAFLMRFWGFDKIAFRPIKSVLKSYFEESSSTPKAVFDTVSSSSSLGGTTTSFFLPEIFHAEARRRVESHLSLLGFLCVSQPLRELFYFEKPAGGL